MNQIDLNGQVAVITGGASGFGLACADRFIQSGARVCLWDRDPATLKTAVFGMIIGTIACYLGFTTTQGTEGVGRTSTRSVVFSSILIIVTNVVLVRLIFFLFPVTT